MNLQDFVRKSLDSSLGTFGTEDLEIAGVVYKVVFDDATDTEELADAGFQPGDICSVTASASAMSAPPALGTSATLRGETWRVYQTRRLGRAAFTIYLANPDSGQ